MNIRCEKRELSDHLILVTISGSADLYTSLELDECLSGIVNKAETSGTDYYDIVIGLDGLDFLDSSGLGLLVGIQHRARAHKGSVSLVCGNPRILKVFEITGIGRMFRFFETEQKAVDFLMEKEIL